MPITCKDLLEVLHDLRNVSGSNAKKEILERHRSRDDGWQNAIDWLFERAGNPYKMYGVVKLTSESYGTYELGPQHVDYAILNPLLFHQFENPRLDAQTIFNSLSSATQEIVSLILNKDLKCGFSGESYNKLFGINLIPTFEVQLAKAGDKSKASFSEMVDAVCKHHIDSEGYTLASFKYDGVRVLAFPDGSMKTRNGKDVSGNYPNVSEALSELANEELVLDGELFIEGGASNKVMTSLFRKKNKVESVAKLHVFDILPTKDFSERLSSITQSKRLEMLKSLSKRFSKLFSGDGPFRIVEHKKLQERDDVIVMFNEAIRLGLEGLVCKDPEGYYTFKRDRNWLKVKGKDAATLKVVGFEEGKEDRAFQGTLGALLLEDGSKCGTGLSVEDRNEIWNNREYYLGKLVDVTFDTRLITKDGQVGKMRFSSFVSWRLDLSE